MFRLQPDRIHDCKKHGTGSDAELFIVEGDSASKNVVRVRDDRFQAVLPMQGKPMNAWKSSKSGVARNVLFQKLIDTLGAGWDETFDLDRVRYDRVMLLFDPDADGIHIGALMSMFFYRWMPELIDAGRVQIIRAPLYEFSTTLGNDRIHAYTEDHFRRLRDHLIEKGIEYQSQRYRGLASINAGTLLQTCVAKDTRNVNTITREDAEAAIKIFGGPGKAHP